MILNSFKRIQHPCRIEYIAFSFLVGGTMLRVLQKDCWQEFIDLCLVKSPFSNFFYSFIQLASSHLKVSLHLPQASKVTLPIVNLFLKFPLFPGISRERFSKNPKGRTRVKGMCQRWKTGPPQVSVPLASASRLLLWWICFTAMPPQSRKYRYLSKGVTICTCTSVYDYLNSLP